MNTNRQIDADAHVRAWVADYAAAYARAMFEIAVASPAYQYSRNRMGAVWIYHSDKDSPTGVRCACGISDIDFADETIRAIRNNSPLSPTEGLQSSGARL